MNPRGVQLIGQSELSLNHCI